MLEWSSTESIHVHFYTFYEMVVCNLCWFYTLPFWSTQSSHFGIWVNSVLCSGSLEHSEHLFSHFSMRGIFKVLLCQMIKSCVWGVQWNLVQVKQSSFPGQPWGCVIPSVHTAPFLAIQSPFCMKRTTEQQLSIIWSPTRSCVTATSKPHSPVPWCQKIPDTTRNSHGCIIWFVLYVESVLVMQILSFVFVYLQMCFKSELLCR